jgi:hypothetical protein
MNREAVRYIVDNAHELNSSEVALNRIMAPLSESGDSFGRRYSAAASRLWDPITAVDILGVTDADCT